MESFTPLTAIAVHNICREVVASEGLPDVFHLCIGSGAEVGEAVLHLFRHALGEHGWTSADQQKDNQGTLKEAHA